jgi:hypothetical protein
VARTLVQDGLGVLQLALLAAQTPAGATWLAAHHLLPALTALTVQALAAQGGALARVSTIKLQIQVTMSSFHLHCTALPCWPAAAPMLCVCCAAGCGA